MVHVAPLGLWVFCYAVYYKHVAPLGLKTVCSQCIYRHVAPLGLWVFCYAVYYKHVAPLGLNEAMRLLLLSRQIFYPENPSKVGVIGKYRLIFLLHHRL